MSVPYLFIVQNVGDIYKDYEKGLNIYGPDYFSILLYLCLSLSLILLLADNLSELVSYQQENEDVNNAGNGKSPKNVLCFSQKAQNGRG